jgi:hypothetical protein
MITSANLGRRAQREHAAARGTELSISVERNIIDVPSMGIALDLSYGLIAMMLRRASNFGIDAREIEAAGLMLLRAFGLPEVEARRISHLPLPLLPELPLRTAVTDNFGAR